jgi:hypothetical protein
MSWKKASSLASNQYAKRGFQASVLAGAICKEAEIRYPGLYRAVSVRKGIMHLEVSPAKIMEFKMIEGTLLKELQTWATKTGFGIVTGFRLTITSV